MFCVYHLNATMHVLHTIRSFKCLRKCSCGDTIYQRICRNKNYTLITECALYKPMCVRIGTFWYALVFTCVHAKHK